MNTKPIEETIMAEVAKLKTGDQLERETGETIEAALEKLVKRRKFNESEPISSPEQFIPVCVGKFQKFRT